MCKHLNGGFFFSQYCSTLFLFRYKDNRISALKIPNSTAEDIIVFKYIFLCCKQSSSASEQNICSCIVIGALLPLQPPACSVQQFPHYPCNAVIASCLSKDHTRKYGVRSGLQGGCGLVIFFMETYSYKGMHSNFLAVKSSLLFTWARNSCITPVLSQKTIAMIFPAGDTFFEFLLIWGCYVLPLLQLLLAFSFIVVDTGFIPYDIL